MINDMRLTVPWLSTHLICPTWHTQMCFSNTVYPRWCLKMGYTPRMALLRYSSRENDESVDLKILYHDFLTDPYSWWLRSHNISMSGLLKCNVRVMKSQKRLLKNLEPSILLRQNIHILLACPHLCLKSLAISGINSLQVSTIYI